MAAEQLAEVDAIRLSPDDNVATLLRAAEAGDRLRVRCRAEIVTVTAREPVPLCHKVSLAEIAAEAPVIKYGSPIGNASTSIPAGAHVHVHNMQSARARRMR